MGLENKNATIPRAIAANGCYEFSCSATACYCFDIDEARVISVDVMTGAVATAYAYDGSRWIGLIDEASAFDRTKEVIYSLFCCCCQFDIIFSILFTPPPPRSHPYVTYTQVFYANLVNTDNRPVLVAVDLHAKTITNVTSAFQNKGLPNLLLCLFPPEFLNLSFCLF